MLFLKKMWYSSQIEIERRINVCRERWQMSVKEKRLNVYKKRENKWFLCILNLSFKAMACRQRSFSVRAYAGIQLHLYTSGTNTAKLCIRLRW